MAVSLKNLQEIGLTESESKIYFYLMENGEKTQSDISQVFGIGVNRVSAVLKTMLSNGIIGIRRIKKIGYYYTTPYELLKKYVEKKHQTKILSLTSEIEKQKENINNVFKSLQEDFGQNNFTTTFIYNDSEMEYFRKNVILPSHPKIIRVLGNLDLFKKNIKSQKQHQEDRTRSGIKTEGVYVMDTNKKIEDYKMAQELKGVFFDHAEIPNIKTNITVLKDYVILSDLTSSKRSMIVIKNKAFAETMDSLLIFIEKTKKKE